MCNVLLVLLLLRHPEMRCALCLSPFCCRLYTTPSVDFTSFLLAWTEKEKEKQEHGLVLNCSQKIPAKRTFFSLQWRMKFNKSNKNSTPILRPQFSRCQKGGEIEERETFANLPPVWFLRFRACKHPPPPPLPPSQFHPIRLAFALGVFSLSLSLSNSLSISPRGPWMEIFANGRRGRRSANSRDRDEEETKDYCSYKSSVQFSSRYIFFFCMHTLSFWIRKSFP